MARFLGWIFALVFLVSFLFFRWVAQIPYSPAMLDPKDVKMASQNLIAFVDHFSGLTRDEVLNWSAMRHGEGAAFEKEGWTHSGALSFRFDDKGVLLEFQIQDYITGESP